MFITDLSKKMKPLASGFFKHKILELWMELIIASFANLECNRVFKIKYLQLIEYGIWNLEHGIWNIIFQND